MAYNKASYQHREGGFSVYNPIFRSATGVILLAASILLFLGTYGRFDEDYSAWFKTYRDSGRRVIYSPESNRDDGELISVLQDSAMGLLFSSASVALILAFCSFFQRTAHTVVYLLPAALATAASGITMTSAIVAIMSVAKNIHVQWSYACQFAGMGFLVLATILLIVEKYTGTPYDEHGLKVTLHPVGVIPAAPVYTEPRGHMTTIRTEKAPLDTAHAV